MVKEISRELLNRKLIDLNIPEDHFKIALEELILEELMAEDRLNDEVREMLKKYDAEIEKGRMDYRKVFDLTKQKLVRERNIIL